MARPGESNSHFSNALKQLGVHTDLVTEWAWVAGRIGVAATAMVGALFYLRNSSAYAPLIGLAGFALVYDAALAFALSKKRLLLTFIIGFCLDNLVLLSGWWVATSAQAGALQTNDLYLILFPVLVIGVMRLGWFLGIVYTTLWMGWMVFTFLTYFPSEAYNVRQLPLRILFMAITAGVVLRLISRLASERQRVELLLHDVRRQADQLAESNLQLQEIDRLRQTFLLTIAQQLKTPITVVKATTEMLQTAERERPDELRLRLLRNLNSGVERLEKLIADVLDFIAAREGRLNLELQTLDIVEVYRVVLQKANTLLMARGQRLAANLPESAPYVSIDPLRCEQILQNLIYHASAWSNHGQTINVNVTVSQRSILTSVTYNGPPLSQGDLEKVFLPFYRYGEPDGKGSAEGGLDLALAMQLTEMHRGRLWVENTGTKGNTFFFTLPVTDKSSPQAEPMLPQSKN